MAAGSMMLAGRGAKWARRSNRYRRRRARHRMSYGKSFQGSTWSPSITLCPDRQFVKLKHTQFFDLIPGSGVASKTFRGNSCVDPDASSPGAGTPAYGFLEWSNFYGRYYCPSSTISCKIMATDGIITQCALFPSTFNITPLSIENASSRARSKVKLLQTNTDQANFYQKGTSKGVIGEPWNVHQTTSTINPIAILPVREWFWVLATKTLAGTATTVRVSVTITYNCVFYERLPSLSTQTSSA